MGPPTWARLDGLLHEGRDIWGEEPLTPEQIVVRVAKVLGDLAALARSYDEAGGEWSEDGWRDFGRELGNLAVSAPRWMHDIGLSTEECVTAALAGQRAYVERRQSKSSPK